MWQRLWFSIFFIILLLGLGYDSAHSQDNILKQKWELEKIKREMEESQNNLDSLQRLERKVQKDIADYEQRASINQTVLGRLNLQLSTIKDNVSRAKTNLDDAELRLSSSKTRYVGNLKYYYMGIRWDQYESSGEVQTEKDALLRILYLRSVAAFDRQQITKSSEYLEDAEMDFADLARQERKVGQAQQKKKSEYALVTSQKAKREKELSRVKRKRESESDRLLSLSEEARQMEDVIAKLETARRQRDESAKKTGFKFATGNFSSYKGGLLAPMAGRITQAYGWKIDSVTKLKSFSPGITIAGKARTPVVAVADGVVAYVGNLRGYGVFVIVEHEDGYYSTYAGLDKSLVEMSQLISRGDQLGAAASGPIKFELRHSKDALDPVEWLKLDNLR